MLITHRQTLGWVPGSCCKAKITVMWRVAFSSCKWLTKPNGMIKPSYINNRTKHENNRILIGMYNLEHSLFTLKYFILSLQTIGKCKPKKQLIFIIGKMKEIEQLVCQT